MISSLVPYPFSMSGFCGPPYTSAVSKKLTPSSIARSMIRNASGSSVASPKFMQPRPIALTLSPDRPR